MSKAVSKRVASHALLGSVIKRLEVSTVDYLKAHDYLYGSAIKSMEIKFNINGSFDVYVNENKVY